MMKQLNHERIQLCKMFIGEYSSFTGSWGQDTKERITESVENRPDRFELEIYDGRFQQLSLYQLAKEVSGKYLAASHAIAETTLAIFNQFISLCTIVFLKPMRLLPIT